MFPWALIFLIVAIIAGTLGLTGIAGTAANHDASATRCCHRESEASLDETAG
jgi:hypothetical protein